ncbi:MAG: peptide-methionine (S)-S-oxide reductase MsrA [Candidatus Omnitrophota bacterium]|nr:peptide-methionine (S)-S-oxide reductase MsrA [Candidatus Omnitrophota bacterium]
MKPPFLSFLSLFLFVPAALVLSQPRDLDPNAHPLEKATFAGGCFWCMEPPFDKLKGVVSTTSGYTGGSQADPDYKEVSSGETGHCEAVEVLFDPSQVSYSQLLDVFWRNIDPTAVNRQFNDVGTQYRTAVFYHSEEQKRLAEASKAELGKSGRYNGKPIETEITPASAFYKAEEYHQDYYKKKPLPYKYYRFASGRDQYLKKIWKNDDSKKQDQ